MDLATPNYSTPIINTTYVASLQFDMRAMGPLYNSTHMIIDAIANKQAYPEGKVDLKNVSFQKNWLQVSYSIHFPDFFIATDEHKSSETSWF